MSEQKYTTIPCTPETQEKIQSLKRGGESYNELLQKMIEQYEPE